MKNLISFGKEIFPICRSITGNGTLNTLKKIKKKYLKDLKIKKISSGQKVFDWKIPQEWNIEDAYVIDKNSKKIIDFKKHNLHVINYSTPQSKQINKKRLLKKLYFIKNYPDAIPYITSYYKKNWGFCVTKKQYDQINKNYKNSDIFKVKIATKFKKRGDLHYGELLIPGKSKKEILLSTYVCHPSMANNELSGPLLSIALYQYFKNKKKLEKSIRLIFIPETIGSIAYINKNISNIKKNMLFGFVLTCVGDNKKFSILTSKYNDTYVDKLCLDAYKKLGFKVKKYSFLERGSDERQFSSPQVALPMISMMRSKYNTYKEYHTSKDNFNFVTAEGLRKSFVLHKHVINKLIKAEEKSIYLGKIRNFKKNKNNPISLNICEPNLGKRGLYHFLGTPDNQTLEKRIANILDFLQYADGSNNLKEIGKLINTNYKKTNAIYFFLKRKKLIK